MADTKTCTKCGVTKPLTEFHIAKNTKDGRHTRCGECRRAKVREEYHYRQRIIREEPKLAKKLGWA